MKLTPVTEQSSGTSQPYVPIIESDTNGSFASYHIVPEEYTKVATFTSTTDFTIGSSLTSTYKAYIHGLQPADTYSGKVKYTLVHPNDAPAPKPEIPESQTATLKGGVHFYGASLANELPEGFAPSDDNILSMPDSPNPVYRYYDSTDGIYKIYTPAKKIYMSADSSDLFRECDESIDDDFFRLLDSSRVTNMESMFEGCVGYNYSLLANWDVSNVANMRKMFSSADGYGPGTFSDLSPLANWDVSNVTNMSGMFTEFNCSEETCHIKSLDPLSNWDTSSVTDMSGMFSGASSLTNIDALSNWDTSNVTNMSGMFSANLSSLTDISGARNWNTSNVTNIGWMFSGANNIDATVLNNWNVSKVTNKYDAFTCPVAQQPCWYNNTICPSNNGNSNSNSNNNNSTSGTNSSPNTNNATNSTSPSNNPASPSSITDDIISNTDSTPNFNQDSSISTISPTNSTNYTNSSNPTSTDEYRSDVIEGSPNTTSPQGEIYYSNTKKTKFNILPLILIIISIIAFLFGLHFFILARRKEEDDSTKQQ